MFTISGELDVSGNTSINAMAIDFIDPLFPILLIQQILLYSLLSISFLSDEKPLAAGFKGY